MCLEYWSIHDIKLMHFTAIRRTADLGYRSTYKPRWVEEKISLLRNWDRQTAWHLATEIGHVRKNESRRQFIDSCFLALPRLFVLLHHIGLGVCVEMCSSGTLISKLIL